MTHTVLAVVHSDLNSASHHSTNTEQYKADSSGVHALTGARCASTGNRYACTETYLTLYVPYTADNNRQVACLPVFLPASPFGVAEAYAIHL